MTIAPASGDSVEFRSRILRTEACAERVDFAYSAGLRLALRCTFCNRIRCSGTWHDPFTAVSQNIILNDDRPLQVGYAVCLDCQVTMQERQFVPREQPTIKT